MARRTTYLLIDRGNEFDESAEHTGHGYFGLALPLEPELRLYVETEGGQAVGARIAVELEGWLFSYRLQLVDEEWQLASREPQCERPDTWGWLPVRRTDESPTETDGQPSKRQLRAARYEHFYQRVRHLLDGLTVHDLHFEATGSEASLSRTLERSGFRAPRTSRGLSPDISAREIARLRDEKLTWEEVADKIGEKMGQRVDPRVVRQRWQRYRERDVRRAERHTKVSVVPRDTAE